MMKFFYLSPKEQTIARKPGNARFARRASVQESFYQLDRLFTPLNEVMSGKIVLITGANSGIGKETSVGLANMGATLVLVCREREKGESIKRFISDLGRSKPELIVADLTLQKEVKRAASEFLSSHDKLHVLINNAGRTYSSYAETEDGVERTMAVNYFAPFILTNLLLDALKSSAPSRIVNVASSAHYGGHVDPDKINGDGGVGPGGLGAYSRSKLALVLFTYELARRLRGTGVTANCLHPGVVRTNFWSHTGLFGPVTRLGSAFMISARKGAETPVYLASSPEVEGVTGKYFENKKTKESSTDSHSVELAARLWEQSEKMTGLSTVMAQA